ncbi:hypothetical protein AGMMS50262_11900 [Bacteroidia bacterium]|nr:hypothetical protein AGMMS50262_11900 [Bacteroidia bacterium]
MKVNTILSVFTPKDVKFLPLLEELADVMVQAGAFLRELFADIDKDGRPNVCKHIKAEEVKGDRVSAQILKELNNTFITPFDREDIMELADKVEEVIDIINRAAQKVLLYCPDKFPVHAVELADIVYKGTIEVKGAVDGLNHLKKSDTVFRKHYKEIKALEETADGVYEKGIMSLFRDEANTVELIKLKEIVQELEKAANKVNATGKVLKTIFVKYA